MKTAMFIILFAAVVFFRSSAAWGGEGWKELPAPNKVIKADNKGRPELAIMVTEYGFCISEIEYITDIHSEIHLKLVKKTGARQLGFVAITGTTEQSMTSEILRQAVDVAVRLFCVPELMPGYHKI